MNAWSWPQYVNAGTCAQAYIEFWDTNLLTANDDGAEVEYTIEGPGDKFQLQARADRSGLTDYFWLQVRRIFRSRVMMY